MPKCVHRLPVLHQKISINKKLPYHPSTLYLKQFTKFTVGLLKLHLHSFLFLAPTGVEAMNVVYDKDFSLMQLFWKKPVKLNDKRVNYSVS